MTSLSVVGGANIFRLEDESSSGGRGFCAIKIRQQDFALKMQGGLMCEGGHICGTLRYFCVTIHVLLEL